MVHDDRTCISTYPRKVKKVEASNDRLVYALPKARPCIVGKSEMDPHSSPRRRPPHDCQNNAYSHSKERPNPSKEVGLGGCRAGAANSCPDRRLLGTKSRLQHHYCQGSTAI